MTPDDDAPDDALTRDYRRSSATEAGRPAATTRAAILAEARSLAQRRARKDPRVPWAIAASMSVIGIAVLLWRQVGLQTPSSPVVYSTTQLANDASGKPERSGEPASATAPVAPPRMPTPAAAAAPRAAPPAIALPASPPSAAPLAKTQSERALDAAADVAMPAPPAAAGVVASALSTAPRPADTEAPASVLRKRFPEEYASPSPPHTLWLLRDARGEVLRTGRLNDSASLQTVSVDVQRAYPARRLSPWVITPLTNERGLPVELAIATLTD